MNVYSSFSHNHQDMEATKVSFDKWMNKKTVLSPYNGILLSNKKKWAIELCKDIDEF